MITADALAALDHVRHGFFTREGGVSGGLYASLNCGLGSGDDPVRVRENRGRAMARMGRVEADLATAYQVHSADVIEVEAPWPRAAAPRVDAMVTRRRGVALGILTADCAPVLFADADAGVVGAAHAGWRGALAGVVEATAAAMEGLGARRARTVAAVGPCIGQGSYEVGAEFRDAFLAADAGNDRFFGDGGRPGKFQFDLAGYVTRRLGDAGVAAEVLPADTCAEADRFFSYRRATLAGESDYGRGLSAIALED